MTGINQTLSSFYRLNNSPLDISLTFEDLLRAKKYVAGLDTDKGTPYNGQIISVNQICGNKDITATFQIVNNIENEPITNYRMRLIDVYRKDTMESLNNIDLIIKEFPHISSPTTMRKYLLMFSHSPNLGRFGSQKDIILSNNPYAFSILGLMSLFYSNDNTIRGLVYYIDKIGNIKKSTISQTVNINKEGENISQEYDKYATLAQLCLIDNDSGFLRWNSDSNVLAFKGGVVVTGDSTYPAEYKECIEIYIDITDYLERDGVI